MKTTSFIPMTAAIIGLTSLISCTQKPLPSAKFICPENSNEQAVALFSLEPEIDKVESASATVVNILDGSEVTVIMHEEKPDAPWTAALALAPGEYRFSEIKLATEVGEAESLDPRVQFRVPEPGTFYVGRLHSSANDVELEMAWDEDWKVLSTQCPMVAPDASDQMKDAKARLPEN